MARIRIVSVLPLLPLPDGVYADKSAEPLVLKGLEGEEEVRTEGTRVQSVFQSSANSPDQVEVERTEQARTLVRRVNRLIRWYRASSADTTMTEITLAKASPFAFLDETVDSHGASTPEFLDFTASSLTPAGFQKSASRFDVVSDAVKEGFRSNDEPPVAVLFLLDARQALNEGRFREAVLFSWSTIDSTFSSRFENMVDAALGNEWGESRKFLKGLDFGLRHRMTIGMRLVAGRSFFQEPDGFWAKLSSSYDRRNKIIHQGESATEAEAQEAIHVAETVVELMTRPVSN
jgi:hypothetical protein